MIAGFVKPPAIAVVTIYASILLVPSPMTTVIVTVRLSG
jgi:hypothetical protein